jgi:Na+-transporting methylmalonyl-CoA/oxaloacetate decarboxylase gamma subunit
VPDSALLSILTSAGVAGVFCVLFIIGAIVPRFVVNDLKAELAEKAATIEAERDRANAAVAAASATRDILAAIQLGRSIGPPAGNGS